MKKRKNRFFASLLAAALVLACCFGLSVNSYAYFDFGTVGVSLGKTSVELTSGQSETVSVTLSPASHDQLPGCGMSMCPQICGELGCFDENGQCTCNGKTYSTYNSTAEVSSDNTSVATASYSGNAVTIKGVSAGEATITVTGSLRQWTSGTATIAVTVTNATGGSSAATDSSDQSASGSSGYSASTGAPGISIDTVAATQVSGTDNANAGSNATAGQAAEAGGGEEEPAGNAESAESTESAESAEDTEETEDTEEEAEENEEISKVDSDMGTIWFIPITGLPQGKEQFEEVMGDETQYLDFQLKDDAENVIYTWEFCGADVERAEDMIFTIDSSRDAFEGCSYGTSNDSLYLSFVQEEDFVGKTSIFYRVSDCFSDDDVLYLYRYNPEDATIELLAEDLAIENGYVTMVMTEGGYDILTTEELMAAPEDVEEEEINQHPEEMDVDAMADTDPGEIAEENTGLSAGAIAAIIIVIAAAVAAVIIFLVVRAVRKKKNGPGGSTEEGESEFWVEAGEEDVEDNDNNEITEERDEE